MKIRFFLSLRVVDDESKENLMEKYLKCLKTTETTGLWKSTKWYKYWGI